MSFIIPPLDRFPRLKTVLRSLYYSLQRLPPISHSKITKELIQASICKPNPLILEIGCNDGEQTLWLNEMFEQPSIYCFEPDPRAIERFKRKVGHHPNIRLFEIALGGANGSTTFYQSSGGRNEKDLERMPAGWDLSGSIKKPKAHAKLVPWVSFNEGIAMRMKTLDTWCEEQCIDMIDFIWMDVQGAEMDVLNGGKTALSRTRFIYTEYSNRELYENQTTLNGLLRHLKNFQVMIRYPNDILLRNRQIG